MTEKAVLEEIEEFTRSWRDSPSNTKGAFLELVEHLARKDEVAFAFKARPGVSYSLRARREGRGERPLFALVDVVDEPDARWLSVCFYHGAITDPEDRGELIPRGILGEDGYCFDLLEYDPELVAYLKARLDEAAAAALPHSV